MEAKIGGIGHGSFPYKQNLLGLVLAFLGFKEKGAFGLWPLAFALKKRVSFCHRHQYAQRKPFVFSHLHMARTMHKGKGSKAA
jgi:hypothetical protein